MTIARSDDSVQVWDVATGLPASEPIRLQAPVNDACFSPEGHRIATACEDGTVRVWSARVAEPLSAVFRHRARVNAVLFTPSGDAVLSASDDGTARCWATPQIPTPTPAWLPALAEALTGTRAEPNGGLEPLPVHEFLNVRAQMERVARTNDFYGRWARGFLGRVEAPEPDH
jgi:WD domain, G-beta repeat